MIEETPGQPTEEEMLVALLARRDVACPRCGYNLRGGASGTCPECGGAVVLTVAGTDPSTTAWVVAVSLYGAATGIAGLFAFAAVFIVILDRPLNPDDVVMCVAVFAGFTASLTGLCLLVRRRRRIWLLPARWQWLMAVSVLGVPIIMFGCAIIAMLFLE